MLSVTLLAKVCSPETRGSMFGFNAMFGSVIIAILQAVASFTFKKSNELLFIIGFGSYGILGIVIILLAMSNKLKQ